MKLFRNILNTVKPHFEKGGKLEKMYPAYDAFETFLFVPDHTTKSGSHIRDAIDLKRTMITVLIALMPALLFGMWNVGQLHFTAIGESFTLISAFTFGALKMLPLIAISYGVGLSIEFAFAISRGHSVNEGYLVTGMLIPMIMPIDVPLWMLVVSVVFAVIIGKEVFGGTGKNFLNPALTGRAFMFFAYPAELSGDSVWTALDGFTGATALSIANTEGLAGLTSTMTWMDAFLGKMQGCIGETSTLAIFIGGAVLLIAKIASVRIVIGVMAGMMATSFLFNMIGSDTNYMFAVPWYWHMVLGGFAFGMIFMATDPVSASMTNIGRLWYGALIGVMVVLIRVVNPAYPEGMMLAILFANLFSPLIDHFVVQGNIKRRLARV